MSRKKGFTLIEMLAVIAILGIATLVIAPSIVGILKRSEDKKYENYLEDLYLAAESYVQSNMENITELSTIGGSYTVSIKLLRDKNLVKQNLINPKTKQNTKDTDGIKITVADDLKHIYTFITDIEEEVPADTEETCFTMNASEITAYTCEEKDVRIPSSVSGVTVTKIGNSVFANKELTSIKIPETVTSIGAEAFSTNNLTSLTLPSGLIVLGESSFARNQIKSVEIPDGVTDLEEGVFAQNALTKVVLPKNLKNIGFYAFNTNQLASLTLPNGLLSIARNAFSNNQLQTVTVPSSVTSIAWGAFTGNNNLKIIVNKPKDSLADSESWGATTIEWTG